MKDIWTVIAHVDGNGIVLNETFDNIDDALAYEADDNIDRLLREHYGDLMADHPSLAVTFCTGTLHEHQP
jgi:hypothetical protein